jgi:hypothetical protein
MDLDLRTRALPERDQGPETRVFAGRDAAAKRGALTAHHTKPVRFFAASIFLDVFNVFLLALDLFGGERE